jgi:hypothetical protein
MAGYGSPPPNDQANNPARQVGRDTYTPQTIVSGPSSQFNPNASPAVNAAASQADAYYRSGAQRYSSFTNWPD